MSVLVASMIRALLLLIVALSAHAQQALEGERRLRLQVSVRFDDAFEASRREVEVGGTIGNRGARAEVRGRESQTRVAERVDQRVQTVDGGRATILTGESRPTRQRQYIQTPAGPIPQEVVVVQERTTGFEVIPRVSGERVTMQIFSTNTVQTVSGRLGEWLELGAIGARRVWAKVETLDR